MTDRQDANAATVRTVVNGTAMTAAVATVARMFNIDISTEDLIFVPPLLAVFYRTSLILVARWPRLGYVLFGINTAPEYDRPARRLPEDLPPVLDPVPPAPWGPPKIN